MASHQTSFTSSHPPDEVLQRFEQYANTQGWSCERHGDSGAEAKQGITLRSWAEHVHLFVNPADNGSAVNLSVDAPQLIDWGLGNDMLEQLKAALL